MINTDELRQYRDDLSFRCQAEIDAVKQKYQRKIAALDVLLEDALPTRNGLNGQAEPEHGPAETIIEAVREAITETTKASKQEQFSSPALFQYLEAQYPRKHIRPADLSNRLWQLRRDGEIEVVHKGSGRNPSIYRKSDTFGVVEVTTPERSS